MAQPHVWLSPAAQVVIDVKKLFAGYTNNPVYTAETTGTGITATLSEGQLTVKAGDTIQQGHLHHWRPKGHHQVIT